MSPHAPNVALAGVLAVVAPACRGQDHGGSPVARCGNMQCQTFPSAGDAFASVLAGGPAVLAVGEAHALKEARGESVTRTFTRDLLPLLKGKASDIVVEILLPNPACQKETRAAAKEQKVVTEKQAPSDQNDFVALATAASALGIRPHPLRPTCDDLQRIAGAGPDAVIESLAVVTRLSSESLLSLVAEHESSHDARLVVAYGGAMHNDVAPRPGREQWSFGPALRTRTSGRYVEVDLIAPEAITDSPSWRALPWVATFDRAAHPESARLLNPHPGAFVLVLPNAVPSAP